MASREGYLAYVLDLLGGVPEVTHRKMMGSTCSMRLGSSLAASTTTASL